MTEEELRKEREDAVVKSSEKFLRRIVHNLCIPDGINGKFDIAFSVNRKRIIGNVMLKLGKEFTEDT